MSSSILIDGIVYGFQVDCEILEPFFGTELSFIIEEGNDHDPYAVSMMKQRQIFGHVPHSISKTCGVHLRSLGAIMCTLEGAWP